MRIRYGLLIGLIGTLFAREAFPAAAPERWVTFRHDYQRTGRTPVVGPQNFNLLKWKKAVASGVEPYGAVTSSPAVGADGTVYVTGRALDEQGRAATYLAAFSPQNGFLKWRQSLGSGQNDSSPSLSGDDTIYVGCGFSTGSTWGIQSYSKSGTFLWWSFLVMDRVLTSPTLSLDEKTVYFGDQSGVFYALDATNVGYQLWPSDQLTGPIHSSAAIGTDGTLYFGSQGDGGRINAISPSGALVWSFPVEGLVEAAPALSGSGMLYFGTNAGFVYAVDTKTVTSMTPPENAFKWRNEDYEGASFFSSVALGRDGTLYVGNSEGQLCAFDPATGRRVWSFDVVADGKDGPGAIYSSPAVGGDGTIYFGSDNGFLYALDPNKTGAARVKAKYNTGSALESSPAIAPDGSLYIGAMDGYLYAFGRSTMGDINNDGYIDVIDVTLLLQAVVIGNASADVLNLGDVAPKNQDGSFGDRRLDVTDAVRILRFLVGFEPSFP